ncbi:unnamed protein product, partial [Heterotrigona itama]
IQIRRRRRKKKKLSFRKEEKNSSCVKQQSESRKHSELRIYGDLSDFCCQALIVRATIH